MSDFLWESDKRKRMEAEADAAKREAEAARIPTRQVVKYINGLPTIVEVVDLAALAARTVKGCKTADGVPSQQVRHVGS